MDADRERTVLALTDPRTGLTVIRESTVYADLPATDWVLYFENRGFGDSPLVEDIQILDFTFARPLEGFALYVLQRTNGAPSNPTDFEMARVPLDPGTFCRITGRLEAVNRLSYNHYIPQIAQALLC